MKIRKQIKTTIITLKRPTGTYFILLSPLLNEKSQNKSKHKHLPTNKIKRKERKCNKENKKIFS